MTAPKVPRKRKCGCGTPLKARRQCCPVCLHSRQLAARRERYIKRKRELRDRTAPGRKPFDDLVDVIDKKILGCKLLNPGMSNNKIGALVGCTGYAVTVKLRKLYDLVADEEPMRFLNETVLNLAPVVAEKMIAGVIAGSPWWIDRWTRMYESINRAGGGGGRTPQAPHGYISDGTPLHLRDLTLINVNMTNEQMVEDLDKTGNNLRRLSGEIASLDDIPGLVRSQKEGTDSGVDVVP